MANTTNLDLVKPAGTDKALVSVINSNSDKIDAFAGTTNQALSNKADKGDMVVCAVITGVSIPDGSTASPADIQVNLTSYIPSGYDLYGADVYILSSGSKYALPWSNYSWSQWFKVDRIAGKTVFLKNASTGWGNSSTLYVSMYLKKTT